MEFLVIGREIEQELITEEAGLGAEFIRINGFRKEIKAGVRCDACGRRGLGPVEVESTRLIALGIGGIGHQLRRPAIGRFERTRSFRFCFTLMTDQTIKGRVGPRQVQCTDNRRSRAACEQSFPSRICNRG